jgi:hypothetical protein
VSSWLVAWPFVVGALAAGILWVLKPRGSSAALGRRDLFLFASVLAVTVVVPILLVVVAFYAFVFWVVWSIGSI